MEKAVVAGHICLDIIPEIDHPFELCPGRLYEVGAPLIGTGGAVSNTGLALHSLGVPTVLMGKIGEDSFGESVLSVLRSYGGRLAEGMVAVSGVVTSYSVVVNIPGTDRIFFHCPGANEGFSSDDVDIQRLKDAAVFHFGYPSFMAGMYNNNGEQLFRLYQKVHQAGLTTSLDPGMPDAEGPGGRADWGHILRQTLPNVDIFLPSADELLYALDRSRFGDGDNLSAGDVSPLGQQLLDMGVAIAGIKLGSRGLYLRTGSQERLADMGRARPENCAAWADRELWFPVFQVDNFVGATGAGDTTIAGFIAAFLRGKPIETCGRIANAVGACNVEAADALSGICSWESTLQRLSDGWACADLDVNSSAWTRDPELGFWHGPAECAQT